MPWRRKRLAYRVEGRPRRSLHHSLWRTLTCHNLVLLSICLEASRCYIRYAYMSTNTLHREPSTVSCCRRCRALPFLKEHFLGFATARCLREETERIRRFCTASLLKLINPIGDRSNHIARRFTGCVDLWLGYWTVLFALFNYSNCFLL